MNDQKNETFHYTYSASQQEEIRQIRRKYAAPEESKMEQLRRLDNSVIRKATTAALVLGVLGALLLGLGMCCCMVWQGIWSALGIPVGLLGIGLVCCAYPAYNRTLQKERAKIAPEILRLTDELMK